MFTFRSGANARLLSSSAVALTAITLGLFLPAPAAHAQFTANFNADANFGTDPNFSDINGGWYVSNPTGTSGVYTSDQGSSPTFNFSTASDSSYTNLTDATITADIYSASDSGLILRSDEAGDNGVVVILRPTQGDFYFIQRSGGNFYGTNAGSADIYGLVNEGDDVRLTFSSAGDTFTASVASLADPTTTLATINYTYSPGDGVPSSGAAGVYQYEQTTGTISSFDNISITNNSITNNAAAPEPGSVALLGMGLAAGMPALGVAVRRRSKVA